MKRKIFDVLFGEEEKEEYYEEEVVYEEPVQVEKPVPRKVAPQYTGEQRGFPVQSVPSLKAQKTAVNDVYEPKRISLDIDDLEERVVSKTSITPQPTIQPRKNKSEYEFVQVLSPMFGAANNKDVTPRMIRKPATASSGVLSPMHGFSTVPKEEPLPTKALGKTPEIQQEERAEHDLVNLTLDEILSRTASLSGKVYNNGVTVTEHQYEEKQVIDSRNMSLFDEEE
ncbi:MAG: hypothetical protein ACK5LZ_04575 [Anaerorhabdus sp.]